MSSSQVVDWVGNGKIYTDLLPNPYPFPAEANPLSQVLIAGQDAGNQDIINLNEIQVTNVTQQVAPGILNPHLSIGGPGNTLRVLGATDLGSIIVGNGTDTKELVCPNTSGATATTNTIYNWLSLANGQSKQFLVSDGTLFHQGYSITIVYSGSDSITGTITSVVANLVTLTITAFTSATYVPTTLITTTGPDPVTATSGGGDPVFIFNPAVCTPTTIPANSFLLTGLGYLYGAPPVVGSSNITLTCISIGAVNPTTSVFSIPQYENPPVSQSAFSWGADGCFLPLGSPELGAGTGGNQIAFAFPTGGSFVNQDFTGSVNGYTLPYTPDGQITINSKLVLTADSTKPLGVFWGVDAQGVGTITSVSAGNNISVSGSLSAPVVNLQSPLSATLALGTQNITGSSSAITLTTGGSVLNETASGITITNATDNTTFTANGVDTNYLVPGVAGANADLNTNAGNAQLFLSSSNLTGGVSHSLQIDCPAVVGNCDILHSSTGGTTRNMDIATEGSLGISAGVVTIPTATTSNTGITLNAGGLAGASLPVKIVNSNSGNIAAPIMRWENTNAVGSVALECYKNKPTAAVNGDVLFTQSCFGKDSGNAKQEFTRINHSVRDNSAGVEDGSIEFGCFVNGAVNTFLQINGNENEVNILRNLDMTGNKVVNVNAIALGSTTSFGNAGEYIISRGSGNPSVWRQPNQSTATSVINTGFTINDTTPTFQSVAVASFGATIPVASGRYKVEWSITIEGVNDDVFAFGLLDYNGTTYTGEIYGDPATSGIPATMSRGTRAGIHYHSVTLVDYFTFPYSLSAFTLSFPIGLYSGNGTDAVSVMRVVASFSGVYN